MIFNPKYIIIKIVAATVCVCFLWQDVVWAAGSDFSSLRSHLRGKQFAEAVAFPDDSIVGKSSAIGNPVSDYRLIEKKLGSKGEFLHNGTYWTYFSRYPRHQAIAYAVQGEIMAVEVLDEDGDVISHRILIDHLNPHALLELPGAGQEIATADGLKTRRCFRRVQASLMKDMFELYRQSLLGLAVALGELSDKKVRDSIPIDELSSGLSELKRLKNLADGFYYQVTSERDKRNLRSTKNFHTASHAVNALIRIMERENRERVGQDTIVPASVENGHMAERKKAIKALYEEAVIVYVQEHYREVNSSSSNVWKKSPYSWAINFVRRNKTLVRQWPELIAEAGFSPARIGAPTKVISKDEKEAEIERKEAQAVAYVQAHYGDVNSSRYEDWLNSDYLWVVHFMHNNHLFDDDWRELMIRSGFAPAKMGRRPGPKTQEDPGAMVLRRFRNKMGFRPDNGEPLDDEFKAAIERAKKLYPDDIEDQERVLLGLLRRVRTNPLSQSEGIIRSAFAEKSEARASGIDLLKKYPVWLTVFMVTVQASITPLIVKLLNIYHPLVYQTHYLVWALVFSLGAGIIHNLFQKNLRWDDIINPIRPVFEAWRLTKGFQRVELLLIPFLGQVVAPMLFCYCAINISGGAFYIILQSSHILLWFAAWKLNNHPAFASENPSKRKLQGNILILAGIALLAVEKGFITQWLSMLVAGGAALINVCLNLLFKKFYNEAIDEKIRSDGSPIKNDSVLSVLPVAITQIMYLMGAFCFGAVTTSVCFLHKANMLPSFLENFFQNDIYAMSNLSGLPLLMRWELPLFGVIFLMVWLVVNLIFSVRDFPVTRYYPVTGLITFLVVAFEVFVYKSQALSPLYILAAAVTTAGVYRAATDGKIKNENTPGTVNPPSADETPGTSKGTVDAKAVGLTVAIIGALIVVAPLLYIITLGLLYTFDVIKRPIWPFREYNDTGKSGRKKGKARTVDKIVAKKEKIAKLRIALLGLPAVGKGTFAEYLIKEYGFVHISLGDILREEKKKGSRLGLEAAHFMDKSRLVPDKIALPIVIQKLKELGPGKGFILDGIPRSRRQAWRLDKLLSENGLVLDAVINLDAPESVLNERVERRKRQAIDTKAPIRRDDMPKVAKKRRKALGRLARPVLSRYRKAGKLYIVDVSDDKVEQNLPRLEAALSDIAVSVANANSAGDLKRTAGLIEDKLSALNPARREAFRSEAGKFYPSILTEVADILLEIKEKYPKAKGFLDVGSGDGAVAMLAERLFDVTAVEYDEQLCEIAEIAELELFGRLNERRVKWVNEDFFTLNKGDVDWDSCDIVFYFDQGFDDEKTEALLEMLQKNMKPGSILIVYRSYYLDPDVLTDEFDFKLIKDFTFQSPDNAFMTSHVYEKLPDGTNSAAIGMPSAEEVKRIGEWLGSPEAQGKVEPREPALEQFEAVKVFTTAGELVEVKRELKQKLGAGLAGVVYEAVDENGNRYVEKFYGSIPEKKLGRRIGLAFRNLAFAVFRGTPYPYAFNINAVLANHYTIKLVSKLLRDKFGRKMTPNILYTRYDEATGGYVQAFEYIEHRRPNVTKYTPGGDWRDAFRLGEAREAINLGARLNAFIDDELGIWGAASQVLTKFRWKWLRWNINLCASTNIVYDEENNCLIALDFVMGIPRGIVWVPPFETFEWGYFIRGFLTGNRFPYADAIDFDQLGFYIAGDQYHYGRGRSSRELREWFEWLRFSVNEWKRSEPVKGDNLIAHLARKGIITIDEAEAYHAQLRDTGKFPNMRVHYLLKTAPAGLHNLLTNDEYRIAVLKDMVQRDLDAGEISQEEADLILEDMDNSHNKVLLGLWGLQTGLKHVFYRPPGTGLACLGVAIAQGQWWIALPMFADPAIRFFSTLCVTGFKYPAALFLGALPVLGFLAMPALMVGKSPHFNSYIIRKMFTGVASKVPGLGDKGATLYNLALKTSDLTILLLDKFHSLPASIKSLASRLWIRLKYYADEFALPMIGFWGAVTINAMQGRSKGETLLAGVISYFMWVGIQVGADKIAASFTSKKTKADAAGKEVGAEEEKKEDTTATGDATGKEVIERLERANIAINAESLDRSRVLGVLSGLTEDQLETFVRLVQSSRARSIIIAEDITTAEDLLRAMSARKYCLQMGGFMGPFLFTDKLLPFLCKCKGIIICEKYLEKPHTAPLIYGLSPDLETNMLGLVHEWVKYIYIDPDVSAANFENFLANPNSENSTVRLVPEGQTLNFVPAAEASAVGMQTELEQALQDIFSDDETVWRPALLSLQTAGKLTEVANRYQVDINAAPRELLTAFFQTIVGKGSHDWAGHLADKVIRYRTAGGARRIKKLIDIPPEVEIECSTIHGIGARLAKRLEGRVYFDGPRVDTVTEMLQNVAPNTYLRKIESVPAVSARTERAVVMAGDLASAESAQGLVLDAALQVLDINDAEVLRVWTKGKTALIITHNVADAERVLSAFSDNDFEDIATITTENKTVKQILSEIDAVLTRFNYNIDMVLNTVSSEIQQLPLLPGIYLSLSDVSTEEAIRAKLLEECK